MSAEKTIKVGDLKEQLSGYSDDYDLFFGGGCLEFYRLKNRGDKLVGLEFSQLIFRNDETGEIIVDE